MKTTAVKVQEAQQALKIDQPGDKKDKEIGILDGRRVATIVTLGVASALALTAAIIVSIFATYVVAALCAASFVSIVIAAIIASRIDISKDLLTLIEQLSQKIEKLFNNNKDLTQEIEKLRANHAAAPRHEEINPSVEELKERLKNSKKSLMKKKGWQNRLIR